MGEWQRSECHLLILQVGHPEMFAHIEVMVLQMVWELVTLQRSTVDMCRISRGQHNLLDKMWNYTIPFDFGSLKLFVSPLANDAHYKIDIRLIVGMAKMFSAT